MKKFLAVLAIAGTLVACNNEGEGTENADSTSTFDSSTIITPATPIDTTGMDTTGGLTPDTTTR